MKITFVKSVRGQKGIIEVGVITSTQLVSFIGKKVKVTIEEVK